MAIYLVIGLVPSAQRWEQDWERKLKGGERGIVPISRVGRVAGGLMAGAYASQLFAQAFHFSLSALTGISSSALFVTTFFLLPGLAMFTLSRGRSHVKSGQKPGG
jgi:hypothetical protein